ncbi:MAG: hypothetical protein Q9214_001230 [Letrouitia sp. 1 TL-2023]
MLKTIDSMCEYFNRISLACHHGIRSTYGFNFSLLVGFTAAVAAASQIPFAIPFRFFRHGERVTSSLSTFISNEYPIAFQGVLNNIEAAGVTPGLVIASPSRRDPDYFYTWTRDSALTLLMLIDELLAGNTSFHSKIEDYVSAQAGLQIVSSPSGELSDGSGLGEPKFNADGSAFTGFWGRPQRDGPALRASALISYSRWLIANNAITDVTTRIWPIISNDLSYVGEYWNQTTFNIWEEVDGSSFFTAVVQYRALVEGQWLAEEIGKPCRSCDQNVRIGRDASTLLASIHTFDPAAGCDGATFQPCSPKALSNHKAVTDSFRQAYSINSGIREGSAVAVGRYLTTLAAAEQLYDALYQWDKLGSLEVTDTSVHFFRDFWPSLATGTYNASSSTYAKLTSAIFKYADEFVSTVQKYTPPGGSMAEQFSRNDGMPLSASNLTWSYASFLTAIARRKGQVPAPWGSGSVNKIPFKCKASSTKGKYIPPTNVTRPCPIPTAGLVAVTFNVRKVTVVGETVWVIGSIPQLGRWDLGQAKELSASRYVDDDPLWFGTVQDFTAEEKIEYKYIKTRMNGTVVWEKGGNRKWTIPGACQTHVLRDDIWRRSET